jgi:hypothetical protein
LDGALSLFYYFIRSTTYFLTAVRIGEQWKGLLVKIILLSHLESTASLDELFHNRRKIPSIRTKADRRS